MLATLILFLIFWGALAPHFFYHVMNLAVSRLRQLRWASLAEGATLLLLLGVAVPLKRLAGLPEAVSVMGPIHGGAFIVYSLLVLNARNKGSLTTTETLQLLGAAFVPFGALMVTGIFRRKLVPVK